jgi:hypothetical protein
LSDAPNDNDVIANLGRTALETDTLVADSHGIAEVGGNAQNPISDLFGYALLRGGRGLLDEQTVELAAATAARGFDGAKDLIVDETRAATDVFARTLGSEQASRMTRILRTIWEGHGGSATSFPGPRDIPGSLTDEDVSLLLDNVTSEEVEFWRRIGSTVSLAQLARLSPSGPSPNLQRLVEANVDRLAARGLRVLIDLKQPDREPATRPEWMISRQCLALSGPDWTAYMAASRDDLPPAQIRNGIPVGSIRHRVEGLGTQITNIQFQRDDRLITYESRAALNVVNDDDLDAIAYAPGRTEALVHTATIMLSGNRGLICDLTTATATGHTSAVFDVSDLLSYGLPLLLDLDHAQTVYLREVTTSAGRQLSLWDDPD